MKQDIIVNNYYLDEEQKRPILDNPKYSLIIAGAGSGKTLTLIGKLKYMLANNLIKKEEICCISFTNEAVENLKKNIKTNCHVDIATFTFHKLALTLIDDDLSIAPLDLQDEIIDDFFNNKFLENLYTTKSVYSLLNIYGPFKNWQYQHKNLKPWKKIIKQFLNLYSSNAFNKEDWSNFFKKSAKYHLLIILYAIYNLYEKTKALNNWLDFDDLIKVAIQKIKNDKPSIPYRLFIIDEFQDTSLLRFKLIEELVKLNNASLCVCGDDYQSIYHFSGSDIDLFLNFSKYFKDAKIYKLETTYRNSQELINIAGNFILKNPQQVTKKLHSLIHISNPVKIIYQNDSQQAIEKILKLISKDASVFILGRTHYDLQKCNQDINNKNIRFLTIHAAKGLEADYVIVLNMTNGLYGFPNQKKDNIILSLVKKELTFPFEEERRLFYTALTRAKKEVYLITNRMNPSIFIKELLHKENVKVVHL